MMFPNQSHLPKKWSQHNDKICNNCCSLLPHFCFNCQNMSVSPSILFSLLLFLFLGNAWFGRKDPYQYQQCTLVIIINHCFVSFFSSQFMIFPNQIPLPKEWSQYSGKIGSNDSHNLLPHDCLNCQNMKVSLITLFSLFVFLGKFQFSRDDKSYYQQFVIFFSDN